MVTIKWKKSWNLGFREIDKQHQHLIEIINRAYEVSLKKDNKKEEEILNEVIEFVRVHFGTEEKYFEKFDYENAEEHIKKHEELTKKALKFKDDFDSGKYDFKEFLRFLRQWFDNHCNGYDRGYVKCFKEHGLK